MLYIHFIPLKKFIMKGNTGMKRFVLVLEIIGVLFLVGVVFFNQQQATGSTAAVRLITSYWPLSAPIMEQPSDKVSITHQPTTYWPTNSLTRVGNTFFTHQQAVENTAVSAPTRFMADLLFAKPSIFWPTNRLFQVGYSFASDPSSYWPNEYPLIFWPGGALPNIKVIGPQLNSAPFTYWNGGKSVAPSLYWKN
ncbi:hypothetical protein [Ktedonospora formicarum]|uniref:hypothetical protein n=1 Tax=Ktedonospora formicarum TaxID=2778364 RepID=UPI001C6878CE|nr:hypothetical protein [Ktedonospora formicarum]